MYKGFGIISLCITRAGNVRNLEFVKRLNDEAVKNGCRLFVYQTCSEDFDSTSDKQTEAAVFELIDYDITDVLVIFDEAFLNKPFVSGLIKKASDKNVSVISVGAGNDACTSFVFDYKSGYEKVVRHVVEYHNIRNTVFVAGGKGDTFSEERIDIYKKVLDDNGIIFTESQVYYGDYWSQPIKTAVKSIINGEKIPEAVICVNDSTAITVCEELKKYGYNVPDDIVVTGFDGISEALCNTPQITTGSCSMEKAVKGIIDAVNTILAGEEIPKMNSIEFDISIYSSCGCGMVADVNIGALLNHTEEMFDKYQKDELKVYGINENLSDCNNERKLIELLNKINFYDMCVVVNNDVLDDRVNPINSLRSSPFDDKMQVLYKTSNDVSRFPEPLDRKDILPDMHYYVSDGLTNPIVFTALNTYSSVIGFAVVCFDCTRGNYCKILQYAAALNNLIGNYRNFRYLKYSAEYIENMSEIDVMTQMYNRKGFYNHLYELVAYAQNTNSEILTATIDMDGLKNINDQFGHNDGDFAIRSVSDAVKRVLSDKSLCGRFGGDEFVVCAVCSGDDCERSFIDGINSALNDINISIDKPYKISASTGVYISRSETFDFEYSLKQSDEKMYIAKLGHPNRRK